VKKIGQKASRVKGHILMDIKRGTKDLPVKSKRLEQRYGVGGATIREAIHHLRVVDKEPICSDSTGFLKINLS
jgi:hypothetical protein